MENVQELQRRVESFKKNLDSLKKEIGKVMVGLDEVIEQVIICLFANGHALLEGVPGLGKTLMVKTLSHALDLEFSRIQFTPDLMPADIVGTNIVTEIESGKKTFQFQKGPIFGNIILADEINRATPKTQSALLEAMQERHVTVVGKKYSLPSPFFVLATQNPIEMEGTFPLPEAQLDRFFFKIHVEFPSIEQLTKIIDQTTGVENYDVKPIFSSNEINSIQHLAREVPIASHLLNYVTRIISATHPDSTYTTELTKKYIRYGASPRGGQSIVLASKIHALMNDRYNVSFDDIKKVILPSLRHRLILNFEGEAEGINTDWFLKRLIEEIPELG